MHRMMAPDPANTEDYEFHLVNRATVAAAASTALADAAAAGTAGVGRSAWTVA